MRSLSALSLDIPPVGSAMLQSTVKVQPHNPTSKSLAYFFPIGRGEKPILKGEGKTNKGCGLMTSKDVQSQTQPQVQRNQLTKFTDIEQLIESARIPNLKVEVLDRSVAIVVPTTVDANVAADTSFHAEQTKQYMAEWFGGVSCFEQEGRYISSDWGMIREKTILVRSYATTEALHQHFPLLLQFVGYLQRQLRQEFMAVELDAKILLLLRFP